MLKKKKKRKKKTIMMANLNDGLISGVWFMHCHLERHASWGMDTVLIVKNGGTSATSIRPPPKYMPPCSKT